MAHAGLAYLGEHKQPGPIADFGTWEGRHLETLLSLGVEVVGTDVPEANEVLEGARRRFPSVRFCSARLNDLPLRSGELGGALCWRVLHNLTARRELVSALAEINRVLTEGAPLVLAVRYERQTGEWSRRRAFVRTRPNGDGGSREDVYFTRGSLQLLASLFGFRVDALDEEAEGEVVNGKAVTNRYLVAHLRRTAPALDNRHVAENLIVRVSP